MERGIETSVFRVLKRRFGILPGELTQKIEGLSIPELEIALDIALDAESLADFQERLTL